MSTQHPVVRAWSGHVPADQADGFQEHLLTTGVAEAGRLEGLLEAKVLRRRRGERTWFTLQTVWADHAGLERFAGGNRDAARRYPGDQRFGLVADPQASHHELVYDRGGSTPRSTYLVAAAAAADLLAVPDLAAAWQAPSALAHYTVGGLAGHLAGQIFFAERILAEPVPPATTVDILEYYDRVAWRTADHDADVHVQIRRGSEHRAASGAAALAAQASETVRRLTRMLALEPVDRLVCLPSWSWTLTFDHFLLSRTVELVVHADDLAYSIGVPAPPLPAAVIDPVLDLLTRLAVQRHGTTAILRALTRAERSPATITVF